MLEIRPYRQGDEKHIKFLFREVLGKDISKEYIRAKYENSAFPGNFAAMLAFNNEEPVGFFGMLYYPFMKMSENFLGGHQCDSIILKDYRGKGLYAAMSTASYEILQKNGVSFVFAMHSEQTLKATLKLGWKPAKPMVRFHVPVTRQGFSRVFKRIPIVSERFSTKLTSILEEGGIDENLQNPLVNSGKLAVDYNPLFYQYKNSVGKKYLKRVGSTTFWLKPGSTILAGCTWIESPATFHEDLKELIDGLRPAGIKEIQFHCTPGTEQYRSLSQNYSALPSWPVGYFSLEGSALDPSGLSLNLADLDTF